MTILLNLLHAGGCTTKDRYIPATLYNCIPIMYENILALHKNCDSVCYRNCIQSKYPMSVLLFQIK